MTQMGKVCSCDVEKYSGQATSRKACKPRALSNEKEEGGEAAPHRRTTQETKFLISSTETKERHRFLDSG